MPNNLPRLHDRASNASQIFTGLSNAGNSGGPLVDDAGRVVGVNTWTWLEGNNLFFALSAKHVESLVAMKDQSPLGFEKAVAQYGTVRTVAFSFPTLDITPQHDIGVAMKQARNIKTLFKCPRCGGDGTIERRKQTGSRQYLGKRIPVYTTVTEVCDACRGSGFSDGKSAVTAFQAFTEKVVQAKQDGEAYQRSLPVLAEKLRESFTAKGKPPAELNQRALEVFAANERTGEPVWFVGTLSEDFEVQGIGRQRLVALTGGRAIVACTELQYNDVAKGQLSVGLGYLAGRLRLKDGSLVPVVQGGLLVRLP